MRGEAGDVMRSGREAANICLLHATGADLVWRCNSPALHSSVSVLNGLEGQSIFLQVLFPSSAEDTRGNGRGSPQAHTANMTSKVPLIQRFSMKAQKTKTDRTGGHSDESLQLDGGDNLKT